MSVGVARSPMNRGAVIERPDTKKARRVNAEPENTRMRAERSATTMQQQHNAASNQTKTLTPVCVVIGDCVAVGDCLTCDGYVVDVRQAPYCPSCSRERKLVAQ